jgi:protein FAM50
MSGRGFKVADAGTVTVEGAQSGSKAAFFAKQREEQAKHFEAKRAELEQQKLLVANAMTDSGFISEIQTEGDSSTVYGLQTKAQRDAAKLAKLERAVEIPPAAVVAPVAAASEPASALAASLPAATAAASASSSKARRNKRSAVVLSFGDDDDDEEDDAIVSSKRKVAAALADGSRPAAAGSCHGSELSASSDPTGAASGGSKRVRMGRNPSAPSWFLHDSRKDAEAESERARLEREWDAQQELVKKEKIEVTYSYWDGSGHRRHVTVPKGATIRRFLEWVRQDLVKDFPEMRASSSADLIYVKEDMIIPQHFSFYDLIISKAKGKTGPLFKFAAEEQVHVVEDKRVEREDSHPGKIVLRHWYDQNRHVYPASRWDVYDPAVAAAKPASATAP